MKIDKERRQWLAGLTDGTKVAIVKEDGSLVRIGKIYTGLKARLHGVVDEDDEDSRWHLTIATGKLTGGYWESAQWIAPLTPEHRIEHLANLEREKKMAARPPTPIATAPPPPAPAGPALAPPPAPRSTS